MKAVGEIFTSIRAVISLSEFERDDWFCKECKSYIVYYLALVVIRWLDNNCILFTKIVTNTEYISFKPDM